MLGGLPPPGLGLLALTLKPTPLPHLVARNPTYSREGLIRQRTSSAAGFAVGGTHVGLNPGFVLNTEKLGKSLPLSEASFPDLQGGVMTPHRVLGR